MLQTMMASRLTTLFVLVALMGGGAACDEVDDLLTYSFDVDSSVTVPGSAELVPGNPLAPDDVFPANFGDLLGTELQQSFETNEIDKDAVSKMTLTAMNVVVDDDTDQPVAFNLDFLDALSFSMSSEGVDPVLVAFSEEGVFEGNRTAYDFETTGNDLVEVLNGGDSMAMETELTTDPPPDDAPTLATTLVFTATIEVVADPVGAVN